MIDACSLGFCPLEIELLDSLSIFSNNGFVSSFSSVEVVQGFIRERCFGCNKLLSRVVKCLIWFLVRRNLDSLVLYLGSCKLKMVVVEY